MQAVVGYAQQVYVGFELNLVAAFLEEGEQLVLRLAVGLAELGREDTLEEGVELVDSSLVFQQGRKADVELAHLGHHSINTLLSLFALGRTFATAGKDGVEMLVHGIQQGEEGLQVALLPDGEIDILADEIVGHTVFVQQRETAFAIEAQKIEQLGKERIVGHGAGVGGYLVVGGVGLVAAKELAELTEQLVLVALGEVEASEFATGSELGQPLLEVTELALDGVAVGHVAEVGVVGTLGLHTGGMLGIIKIDAQGLTTFLVAPLHGKHGQTEQVGMHLLQGCAEGLHKVGGLHAHDGLEGFEYLLVGQRHGAVGTVLRKTVEVVAKETIHHDGEPFGTAFGKEVTLVNTVFGTPELFDPALDGLQPIVKAEAHKKADVQVVAQTVVARREATGYVVGFEGEEEHVAALTEDGHLAAFHHKTQVFEPCCDELGLVFFHNGCGLAIHDCCISLYVNLF